MHTISFVCLAATWLQQAAPAPPAPSEHAVELRITDSKGGPVQSARVRLLAPVKRAGGALAVNGHAARELAPKDFPGDFARLDGLPPGRFVLLVEADNHAATVSGVFELPAAAVPQVTVALPTGATLEGVVTDATGKPLAGVELITCRGEHVNGADNPFAPGKEGALVPTTTRAIVRSAADGSFRFRNVAAGEYQIVARHDAFAPGQMRVTAAGDERVKLPRLELREGVVVGGRVSRRGGAPVAGAEVVLQPSRYFPGYAAASLVAITDEDGEWRAPCRLPTGASFLLFATDPKDPSVARRKAQFNATQRTFEVGADGSRVEDLQLPAP